MLMLCTSSWNVSGRQCLLLTSTGATWRLVPFCGCCIYLVLFFVSCSKRVHWTVHFHKPRWLGPTVSASLFLQERLRLDEVQSLKTKESWKKFNKKTENGYLSGRLCPAAHKQKSLLPVSVTALIQAQTDPIAEDLPASCRPGQPWREGGFSAAPASRDSLYRYICQQSMYIRHNDT